MKIHKRGILQNQELDFKGLLKNCFLILGITFIISFFVTLILAAIFFSFPDPTSKISIASLVSMYISVFLGGFILSKVNKQRYFAGGLILGIMLFTVNIILSLIFVNELETSDYIWKLLIPVICILGSMVGIKKERKSYRKKRFLK